MRLGIIVLTATVAFACSWDYPIWIPRSKSADPLYRFIKNDQAGYIDRNGRVVIPPKLKAWGNYGSEFHDGLLEIAVSDGVYVDQTGKVVIDKGLYRGWDFSEGLAVAMRKGENLWGYIDSSGEFAISPRFAWGVDDYVWPFEDGLAKIKVKGKVGYIDHSGEFVIKPQFLDGIEFSDGMARVVTEGPCVYFPDKGCGFANPEYVGGREEGKQTPCRFTFIDKTGRVITQERFDYAHDFSEGLAPVRIGSLWGFIDKTGALVVSPRFDGAEPFSSSLSRIQQHGSYGYADRSGAIRIAPQYKYADDFSEGFAVVGDRPDHYWYINQQGKRTIPGEFAAASPFFKGLAHVRLLQKDDPKSHEGFAYIDTTGRRVFTY
jgi:hypothetical protein